MTTRRASLAAAVVLAALLGVALTWLALDRFEGTPRMAVSILQVNLDGIPSDTDATTIVTDASDLTYWPIADGIATRAGTVYFDGLPTADEGPVTLTLRLRARSSSAIMVDTLLADITDPYSTNVAGPSFGPLTSSFAYYYISFELDWYAPDEIYMDFLHFDTFGWDLADVALVSSIPAVDARYSALEVLPGSTALVNSASVTRDGLDDVRAADEESVAQYGHRGVTVDVALASDSDAEDLASFHANRRSQPTPMVSRIDAVIGRESPAVLNGLARLDLGDLVTVHRTTKDGRALDFSATVESIRWDLTPGRQSLSLSTAPSDTYGLYGSAAWFVVGESLLGGTAVLAPY